LQKHIAVYVEGGKDAHAGEAKKKSLRHSRFLKH
jgi:hypothetical protein